MAADGSSTARLLRGETGKKEAPSEMGTLDLLGGFGGGSGHGGSAGEDEFTNLEVKVPAGEKRWLDLPSSKMYLTPHCHGAQGAQNGHQDLNLPPPTASAAVWTLDMVRFALEHASARRSTAYPATSSSLAASISSLSSSVDKRHRSSLAISSMRAATCPSCLTCIIYEDDPDPRCPRCSATVPPQVEKTIHAATTEDSGKKQWIDLNVAADETSE